MYMNTNDFNKLLDKMLISQTKKIIKEQVEETNLLNKVKSFQTLSGLLDKISNVRGIDNKNDGFVIEINDVSVEELTRCCGGNSIEEAQKNLLQGLHHDMEEHGLGNNMDIELSVNEQNGVFNLNVNVTTNNEDMFGSEITEDDENEKEDNLILGSKEINKNDKKINKLGESKMKKIVRLRESQLVTFVSNLINESDISQPYTKSVGKSGRGEESTKQNVPGLETAKKSRNESGVENKEHLKNTEKKMKDYSSFDGNDNPEFPKQIGKGEKMARKNTPDQEQEIKDNRGRGPQDLTYDNENFAKDQTERIKKALGGDSTMGNGEEEGGNTIKTDTGKEMEKNIKIRQNIKKEEPLYNKESVPVDTKKKMNEELEKMKKLYLYNKRTQ